MRLKIVDDGYVFEPANAEAISKGGGLHLRRSKGGEKYMFNQMGQIKNDRCARTKVAPALRTHAREEDSSPTESVWQVARKKTDSSTLLQASTQADRYVRGCGSNRAMAGSLTAPTSAANLLMTA